MKLNIDIPGDIYNNKVVDDIENIIKDYQFKFTSPEVESKIYDELNSYIIEKTRDSKISTILSNVQFDIEVLNWHNIIIERKTKLKRILNDKSFRDS